MKIELSKDKEEIQSLKIKALTIGSSILILLLCGSMYLTYKSTDNQKIILLPPTVNNEIEFNNSNPNKEYMQMMGYFFVGLKYNFTPFTVTANYKNLLQYFDSTSGRFPQFVEILDKYKKSIIDDKISSVFYPRTSEVNLENLTLRITGTLKKWAGKRPISDELATFEMQFKFHGTAIEIIDMYRLKEKKS